MWRRLKSWLPWNRWRRREADLERELRNHLDLEAEERQDAGLSAEEAAYAARRALGSTAQIKEDVRAAWGYQWLETLLQDLRYGFRQNRRNPGFTIVAILTLSLGIGANVAIFSLINQTLLRSLPVRNPKQLVVLSSTEAKAGTIDAEYSPAAAFSYPTYKDLRDKSRGVFAGLLACYPYTDVNVSWHGRLERAGAELVSGNFFQVLGVRPALGRVFSSGDETAPGANIVVVLSYRYWREHFRANPSILNQTLDVNANPLTIVGVAERGFTSNQAGESPDLFIPITMFAPMVGPSVNRLDNVSDYFLGVMGRLGPGVTRARAQAELQPAFHAILEAELPTVTANKNIVSSEGRKGFLAGKVELGPGAQGLPVLQQFLPAPMALLMGLVGLVLLIACANLAGLLLARGETRQHEIAVRLAVGASRGRLVRQLLTEALIVSGGGGAAGLLFAWLTLRAILGSLPHVELVTAFLSAFTASLDLRVVAFAAAATMLSLLLFALVPALKASHVDLQAVLKEQSGGASGGAASTRMRNLLVVAQVASAAALLIAAGLFGESLVRVGRASIGMQVEHVAQFSMDPSLSQYSPARTVSLFDHLRQDIAALPGVSSAGVAETPLLADTSNEATMKYEDFTPTKNVNLNAQVNNVSPRFFSTLGIPLMEGREFLASDSAFAPRVAIINEKVAQRFFPGRNPIGMRLAIGWAPSVHPNIEIVGVVADAKSFDARSPVQPSVYFPYAQAGLSSGTFYVRTQMAPSAMMGVLRKLAAQDAPNVPVYAVRTLTEQVGDSLLMFGQRVLAVVTLSLALVAALLAAVGLYGVMAYSVVRRTREIAIRMALGAERRDVLKMVVRQGLKLTLIGVVIGTAAALGLTRFLASLLYGVKPTDPVTFIAVSLILIAVALLACYIPARRAAKVDPMVALRYE